MKQRIIVAVIGIPLLLAILCVAPDWATAALLAALGVALVFPILTLAILDMFPRVRGAASSMQAFIGLLLNAIVAGLLSPWLSGDLFRLALAAGAMSVLAWALWRWEMRVHARTLRSTASPAALEPTDL